MTGIIVYDAITEDFAILIDRPDGELCEGYAATAEEAARRLEESLTRWRRHDEEYAQQVAFAEQKEQKEQLRPPEKCPWHRAIRRFFAISIERGLDPKDDFGIRAALSCFWGRTIETRSELSASDWWEAGDAVKKKQLSW